MEIWLMVSVTVRQEDAHPSMAPDPNICICRGSVLPYIRFVFGFWIMIEYLLKNLKMNKTVKEKVNFMNSSQNEGSSPSCIALSFDGFGSMSWHSVWFSRLFYSFHNLFFGFPIFSAWVPMKRLDQSKCASGASKLVSY
jgi:hypothetical protein